MHHPTGKSEAGICGKQPRQFGFGNRTQSGIPTKHQRSPDMPVLGAKATNGRVEKHHKRQNSTQGHRSGSKGSTTFCAEAKPAQRKPVSHAKGANDNYWRVLQTRCAKRDDPRGNKINKVLGPNFREKQKGLRENKANHRSARAKSVPCHTETQATDMETDEADAREQPTDLGYDNRPAPLFPSPRDPQGHEEMDAIPTWESSMANFGHAIRLEHVSVLGPQIGPADQERNGEDGHTPLLVCRRHPDCGDFPTTGPGKDHQNGPTFDTTWHPDQFRQEHEATSTTTDLFGSHTRPKRTQNPTSADEIRLGHASIEASDEIQGDNSQAFGTNCGHSHGHGEIQHQNSWRTTAINEIGSQRCQIQHAENPQSEICLVQEPPQIPNPCPAPLPADPADPSAGSLPSPTPTHNDPTPPCAPDRCITHRMGGDPEKGWDGNTSMCIQMDSNTKENAHNTQRSTGISTSGQGHDATHPTGHTSPARVRCNIHSDSMEKGQQSGTHEQSNHPNTDTVPLQEYIRHKSACARKRKWEGRLPVSTPRRQKLSTGQQHFPVGVQETRFPTHDRPICQQVQPTSSTVLQLASGSPVQGERLAAALGTTSTMDESALGAHPPVFAEAADRPGSSFVLPPRVAHRSLVANRPQPDQGRGADNPTSTSLLRSRRPCHACPTLGNPFLYPRRPNEVIPALRAVEAMHDVPISQRQQWLRQAMPSFPTMQGRFLISIRRLKAAGKAPKYPIFYDIDPLLKWAFPPQTGNPPQRPPPHWPWDPVSPLQCSLIAASFNCASLLSSGQVTLQT